VEEGMDSDEDTDSSTSGSEEDPGTIRLPKLSRKRLSGYRRPGCCTFFGECLLYHGSETLASWIASKVLSKKSWIKEMPDVVRERVMNMDLICKFALLGVAVPCHKHVEVSAASDGIGIRSPEQEGTTFFEDPTVAREIPELGIWIPLDDEQSSSANTEKTGVPKGNWKKLKLLAARQIDDDIGDDQYFDTVEEGEDFCKGIRNAIFGRDMKWHEEAVVDTQSRRMYTQPALDESQGDIAYYGIGQLLLRRSDDPERGDHMCDLRRMYDLEVRPAFERYGACAYFRWPGRQNLSGDISCIYWCHGARYVYPGSEDWEHAKWVWRCSLFLWDTAVDHLVYSHFITSNALTTSVRGLPINHPIRRVMHINTFGTCKVNQEALLTLQPRHALLHHACALEYAGGLAEVFVIAAKDFRYRTLPQEFEEQDLPDEVKKELPVYMDGLLYWRSLNTFYKGYVDLFYPNDAALLADEAMQIYWKFECVPQIQAGGLPPLSKVALVDQLTYSTFMVSFFHQMVGDVIRYLGRPDGMCWHIREGEDMADAKALLLTMNIAAKTLRDMPEIIGDAWYFGNWQRHLFEMRLTPFQRGQLATLLGYLKAELAALRTQVEERNSRRPDGSRPAFWACSVSL
jgi:hypothetical protein